MTLPFARRTYASAEWQARASEVFPGGTTRSTLDVQPAAPYFASAAGHLVVDVDGRQVIDLQNNYTSLIHGHARLEVVRAATAALERGASVGLPSHYEIELAEILTARFGLERLRFANSGTEAVMMAIRTARAHSGRHTIIRFRGAYHGTFEDVVDGAHAEADAIVVDFNDADGLRVAASGAEIAAILVDLMPNRAGMIEATPMFIQAIHETAEATGALIIADEVITARLGGGGLSPQLGLRPDLVALGKIIGGGHPVGAFGGRSDVMAVYQPGAPRRIGHGGTFTANPVTMAAGRAALLAFGEDEVQRIDALGERLRRSLSDAGMDVAGRGSLVRIRSAADGRLWWAAYREGVLIGNNGLLAVSTAMDESVIDLVADRLQQAVATVTETSLS